MDASRVLRITMVLSICAVIFQIIGLASPYWVTGDTTNLKFNLGLWKLCVEGFSRMEVSECYDIKHAKLGDWFKAVQALSIMGLLSLLLAVVMVVLKLFVLKDSKAVIFVAIGASFAGAVFILISIAVFADKINELNSKSDSDLNFHYHFAFALSIMGMLAAIGCGVAV
ncbi:uncharacterized protein LOC125683866 [Ostrea edulis]|uniref:uncharacterized protein LOC125683866 n=1 Tax=Ostrea edulis TaxID=37623 RepID=UPI00209581A6|nr:uncharacterized protein LOC125683866 [Ostrea edulis]